ncbi:MAG: D-glycero-beta-D-manno-heptose 1,7-bisphosphate 7-phosphatase [Kangiellaceae bacterium]|nr:D-glycero-beta-D-manno-heptose 1,7-bisphosphate 7-phosphatase [Kangiellaceae bacterium]MCW8997098.1 D-glycero-beta-D-manno-heptose 1,7-bisphosphate 7-phosphatase [Kangiellaceae bacterium]MCW9017205.1 D-glycero-beta-D-manno-heptose 1,7-bisphosphate 7-phosphatase [Kangiellaceae bacterium]
MSNSKSRLIILDRDGVINHDSDDYIKSPEEWLPIESSLKAIARLNQAGYKVAIATNQSGIARGYFNSITLTMIHKKMELALANAGAQIHALEFCPDHPDHAGPNRKPNPGMALKLLEQFNAVPQETWFVGDSISDIQCAQNAYCRPALVLTGKGQRTRVKPELPGDVPIFEDLAGFVELLLSSEEQ